MNLGGGKGGGASTGRYWGMVMGARDEEEDKEVCESEREEGRRLSPYGIGSGIRVEKDEATWGMSISGASGQEGGEGDRRRRNRLCSLRSAGEVCQKWWWRG